MFLGNVVRLKRKEGCGTSRGPNKAEVRGNDESELYPQLGRHE